MWKKNPDNWPEGRQNPEELNYINDLSTSSLHSSSLGGCPHPYSLDAHLCLVSVSSKQTISLFALPRALSLIIHFIPTFAVSASMTNAFFTGGKDPGKNSS